MANMILTSECEQCIHSTINEEDRARVKVYCKVKDRTYYWGTCIPCDYKEKKKDDCIMIAKIKKLKSNALIPTKGSDESAGYDLYACIDKSIIINPHETKKLKLDWQYSHRKGILEQYLQEAN